MRKSIEGRKLKIRNKDEKVSTERIGRERGKTDVI